MRLTALSWQQNLVCAAIGAFSLIWAVVIKLVLPPRFFEQIDIKQTEMDESEAALSLVASLRRSMRSSKK